MTRHPKPGRTPAENMARAIARYLEHIDAFLDEVTGRESYDAWIAERGKRELALRTALEGWQNMEAKDSE